MARKKQARDKEGKTEDWKNKKERKNIWKYAFWYNTDAAYISDLSSGPYASA